VERILIHPYDMASMMDRMSPEEICMRVFEVPGEPNAVIFNGKVYVQTVDVAQKTKAYR
jgi:hypothetical protein